MEREIKFRFWDLDTKRMITHHEGITQNSIGKSLSTNIRPLIRISGEICQPHWGKNCVIMQLTGLKDKNNVEIYEGDIVKYSGRYHEIKYFPKWGMFGMVGESSYKTFNEDDPLGSGGSSTKYKPYILGEYYQKRMEVVGNIYENKELLK